jgi:hypothetical protein
VVSSAFVKFFLKRDKIGGYSKRNWAKQKIIDERALGLCFLLEVVYNKIAVSVPTGCELCTARRNKYLEHSPLGPAGSGLVTRRA